MTRKVKAVDKLSEYFAYKGRVMSRTEYVQANDGPLSLPAIKRSCGSWSRMLKICERAHPDRMAIARGSKPAEKDAKVDPKPPVPERTDAPVKTAAEALRDLEANNE